MGNDITRMIKVYNVGLWLCVINNYKVDHEHACSVLHLLLIATSKNFLCSLHEVSCFANKSVP